MKLLALECATMLGGVAVIDSAEGLIAEVRLNVKSTHSERLMVSVEQALALSGLTLADMDALAVSAGPGAFTGLRIGLSTVKGLAFSTGLPVVAVPTLEAYASALAYSRLPVCPMLDARKGEVYAALYSTADGSAECLMPPLAAKASALPDVLSARGIPYSGGILFAGQGALIYKDELLARFGGGARFAPEHLMVPSPAAVAALGLRMAMEGRRSDPAAIAPIYIRRSEAETQKEG